MWTALTSFLTPIREYLWMAAFIITLVGGVYFIHHERVIGEQRVEAADARARATLDAKVAEQTKALQLAAKTAGDERDVAQQTLKDYMAAHPIGPVLVCHQNSGGVRLQAAPDNRARDADPSPRSPAVGQVPDGSAGQATDIGPELDTLVRSAGELASLYRESQEVMRAER